VAGALALALAALALAAPSAGAEVRIGPRAIVVSTPLGRAVIARRPVRIAFLDRTGRPVLRELAAPRRSWRIPPPPAPIAPGYGPPMQATAYAPLAFTVGHEAVGVQPTGVWAGDLESVVRTGTIHAAVAVRSARRWHGGVRLIVTTTDPSGRVLDVRVVPGPGGVLCVSVLPSPSAGVAGVADTFSSPAGEAFHGFGGRHIGVDQRGEAFYDWTAEENLDAGSFGVPGAGAGTLLYPNGPEAAYYPQASFLSSRGYGFLLDRPELSRFRLASDRPDAWQLDVSARRLDYVVAPAGAARAIGALTAITGRQPVPPAWALRPALDRAAGLNQKPAPYAATVRSDLREIRRHHLSLGSYRLEAWGVLPRSTDRSLIAAIHRQGMRAMVYFRAFVAKDGAGTETPELFRYAVAHRLVAHRADGSPATFGNSFGGTAAMLDFTNPATLRWWAGRVRGALDLGADGFMQDFGEEVLPDAIFHDGTHGLAMHNRYPVVFARATRRVLDAYRRAHPRRSFFFFTRAGYSGSPGSAAYENANFPGDETTDWTRSSGIASQVPDMLNRAVGGAYGFTTDIGGYFDIHSPPTTKELFLRWAELAALTPFFRVHGSLLAGTHVPWSYDAQTLRAYRTLAALHERAIPLILHLWREADRTGIPPTRPLWLAAPGDARAARQDQEWMLGRDVLVAPVVVRGARRRAVYLPAGCWRREGRGPRLAGRRTVTVPAPLTSLPWFERCGTRPLAVTG